MTRALIVVLTLVCSTLNGCATDHRSTAAPTTSASHAVGYPNSGTDRAETTVRRIGYPTTNGHDSQQNWGDLYLPAGPQHANSIALLILIHGGGWASPLGAGVFDPLARDLTARGFAVYNIEYRRLGAGGGWPTTFDDVAQAIDNVVAINHTYPQLRLSDSVVVGHSAGGQLAVWAGTRHGFGAGGKIPTYRPTKAISLAGPLDMTEAALDGDKNIPQALGGTPSEVPDRYTAIDPIENIDPATPVIAVHGTDDTVVAPWLSQRYINELKNRHGHGKVVLLPGETHTSFLNPTSTSYGRVLGIIADTATMTAEQLDE